MALTAAVTLAVAGALTWVVTATTASSARISPASGLPTDDPCAVLSDRTLASMDGEARYGGASSYSSGCDWRVTLAGEERISLHFRRSVPFSAADAALLRERDPQAEELPTDARELYESTVEGASERARSEAAQSRDRPLRFGDESTLVLADFPTGSGDSHEQVVALVVREGRLVSEVTLNLGSTVDDIDLNEAEELLADVAADAFG
ncbi:hypothetical protein [Nocardiopsis prasina]|uniref:hypothetical protein n=1 Tax=Nocardiopsis prasina TaxID=2015 RepID=UPI00034CDB2D|nr:hypothetical protein [Nocardiopsis prasina]